MKDLDQDKIKCFYNNVPNVWGTDDPWHEYSQKVIYNYLKNKKIFQNSLVLNAGSAGNSYDIACNTMYHVDIAEQKIKNIENAFVASIENLPFAPEFFDNIICVGSVLNYCDAISAISELSRVLRKNGDLIIEYESSWGFEYLGHPDYKKDACIITTKYIEENHMQWIYSPAYIEKILENCGLNINSRFPFHIIDGFISKFANDKIANFLSHTDIAFRIMPYFRKHGNNIIIHCTKNL